MSSGWSFFIVIGTLATMAGGMWLLISNRDKPATGERMDHEFDGIEEFDNPLPVWWVMLFVISTVFGLGYLVWYPGLGNMAGAGEWSSAKEWQYRVEQHEERHAPLFDELAALDAEELINQPRAMQIGRRLFLNNCSTCHGFTAQGGTGFPNLTDAEWIWGAEFDTIKTSIINGRVANMPPWGQVLSAEQISEVIGFIRALGQDDTQAAMTHPGQTHYATYCIACHGAQGEGNSLVGGPSLNDSTWLYGGDDAALTDSIANGRMGNMPAQGDILGIQKAHVLAAYIYSLRVGTEQPATP